ncbi:MAG: NAD-dependent epimerase/dehydratase family protein [Hyphomicrobiales bacterium]
MKIMVTGGTGFVGGRVAAGLLERGDKVVALAREPGKAAPLAAAGAKVVQGDLTEPSSLSAAARGCDTIVHAAGLPLAASRKVFHRIHVEGSRNVVRAAQTAGVRRLVNIASDAVVFAGRDLRDADESMPYPARFIDVYSETKALGEQQALAGHGRSGLQVTSLRPAIVWGRGDTTVLPIMAKLAAGWFGIPAIGKGENLEASCHIENLLAGVLAALDAPEAHGRAYFLLDDFQVGWREFLTRQMEAVGIRPKFLSVPAALAVPAAWALDRGADLLGLTVPLAYFGVRSAMTNRHYCTTRAHDELGYRPRVGFEEGLEDLGRWVEEIGGRDALIAQARL